MTFEDFLEDSQISYSTIETKEDLKRVIEKAWNSAIKAAIEHLGEGLWAWENEWRRGDPKEELKSLLTGTKDV